MGQVYIVQPGDWLAKIAARFGFSHWETIYYAAENSAFRSRRRDPNLLNPGDRLFIPTREAAIRKVTTGLRHSFVVRQSRERLRIVVRELAGRSSPKQRYRLVADRTHEGVLQPNGVIEHPIARELEEAHLTVWLDGESEHHWTLKIGHLDPVDELTGIQARLNNLGFRCGSVDGIIGPKTVRAIRDFQRRHGLKADGVADSATLAKLREAYGS